MHQLSARGLKWAVGLSRRQNVYLVAVAFIFSVARVGRRRRYSIPDQPLISAEAALSEENWRSVNWRRGTKQGERATGTFEDRKYY